MAAKKGWNFNNKDNYIDTDIIGMTASKHFYYAYCAPGFFLSILYILAHAIHTAVL